MTIKPLKEVRHTWEETSFSQTKEESASQKGCVVLDQAHQSHDQTPEQDDSSEEDTGCKALEHDVGGRFSQTYKAEGSSQHSVPEIMLGDMFRARTV
jgi:hypothetical protein